MTRPNITSALRQKAEEIAAEAKTRCKGKLSESIRVLRISEGGVDVGSDLPYALPVELGTERRSPLAYLRGALHAIA